MKITLKAARTNAGYSQSQASDLLDISRKTLSNWERGVNFPSAQKIMMIEKIYNVKYDDLIFLRNNYA